MIYVGVEDGAVVFREQIVGSGIPGVLLTRFSSEQRPDLVAYFRSHLAAGWDGRFDHASGMALSKNVIDRARIFVDDCVRAACVPEGWKMDSATACTIIESCGNDGDENEMTYAAAARYLAQRVRGTETERDTLSRELAELEHTHDQLCAAAVTLADECEALKRRLAASQKELLRALAEAEGAEVLSRSASDEPLGETTTPPPIARGQRWQWREGFPDDVWEIVHWDCNKDDWEVIISGPLSAEIRTRQTLPWDLFHKTWKLVSDPEEDDPSYVPLFAPCVGDMNEPEDYGDDDEETPPIVAPAAVENEAAADAALSGGDFVVTAEEFAALLDILENPPPPTPALVALMRKTPEAEDPPPAPSKKKKKRDRP